MHDLFNTSIEKIEEPGDNRDYNVQVWNSCIIESDDTYMYAIVH